MRFTKKIIIMNKWLHSWSLVSFWWLWFEVFFSYFFFVSCVCSFISSFLLDMMILIPIWWSSGRFLCLLGCCYYVFFYYFVRTKFYCFTFIICDAFGDRSHKASEAVMNPKLRLCAVPLTLSRSYDWCAMCVHASTRISSWESVGSLVDMGMDLDGNSKPPLHDDDDGFSRSPLSRGKYFHRKHSIMMSCGSDACVIHAWKWHIQFRINTTRHQPYIRSRAIHDKLHFSLWFFNDVLRCVAQLSQQSMPVGLISWINFGNLLLEFFVRNTVCAFFILQSIRIHFVSFAMRTENHSLAVRRSKEMC